MPGAGSSFFCFDLRSKSVPRERRSLRDVARFASKKLDSRFLVASLELPPTKVARAARNKALRASTLLEADRVTRINPDLMMVDAADN